MTIHWTCSVCGKPTAKPWRQPNSLVWTCAGCVASTVGPCAKYRFRSLAEAEEARDRISDQGLGFRRAYWCEPCGAFHLTRRRRFYQASA